MTNVIENASRHLVRLITMVDLFVVLPAKIPHTLVAVMASAITQFFSRSASSTQKPSDSDNIILAPESINPLRNPEALIEPDEFMLQGKQYIRCSKLARKAKHTKKRSSVIWLYGDVEDGPQILDGGGAGESSDEENTAAGTVGKDDDIY